MAKKQLASTIIMNEKLLCGGEWKTRRQLQSELLAEGHDPRLVDWYLFCLSNHQPCSRLEGEVMEVVVPNACTVAALRELLGDPTWGPEELGKHILLHNGLPSEDTKSFLERLAPVKVWGPADLSGDETVAVIKDEHGQLALSADEKVALSYATTEGRAHMECVQVRNLRSYLDRHLLFFITRRDA